MQTSFNEAKVYLCLNPLKQGGDVSSPWPTFVLHDEGTRFGQQIAFIDIDKDGDLDNVSSADHECDYYSAEGTHHINLVWWENRTPQKKPAVSRTPNSADDR
jgi:hypothetical protein